MLSYFKELPQNNAQAHYSLPPASLSANAKRLRARQSSNRTIARFICPLSQAKGNFSVVVFGGASAATRRGCCVEYLSGVTTAYDGDYLMAVAAFKFPFIYEGWRRSRRGGC